MSRGLGDVYKRQNEKDETRDEGKALTYREWKDQQLQKKKMNDDDERPQKYGKSFKERKYVDHEEKPSNRYYHEPPRRPRYTRDFERKSPPQSAKSPTYFSGADRLHQVSRKRTYSNNSDSISSNDVKKFKQYEQVSPEPGEIT